MRSKNTGSILTALALAAVLATGTLVAETIKIGVADAHSCDLASYGLPTLKAAQLVVKDINEKGGIIGALVKLIVGDDACKPEIATNTGARNDRHAEQSSRAPWQYRYAKNLSWHPRTGRS